MKTFLGYVSVATVLLVVISCGKQEPEAEMVATVDGDTLTADILQRVSPDSVMDSVSLHRTVLQVALAGGALPADSGGDKDAHGLAEQLSLRSGQKWKSEAAASRLAAARTLKKAVDSIGSKQGVVSFIDSLFQSRVRMGKDTATPQGSTLVAQELSRLKDDTLTAETDLGAVLAAVFGMPQDQADILAEYALTEGSGAADSADVSAMVKGLVFDSVAHAQKKALAAAKAARRRAPQDNSEQVLKYRGMQSIKDSIAGHDKNIQALYKKVLKTHPSMQGRVMVRFRVDAAGKVIEARVASSRIRESEFLDPLVGYVREIEFKEVPDHLGNMTFEFPFEFTPE